MLFSATAFNSIDDSEVADDSDNNADCCGQVRCRFVPVNEGEQGNARG